jgi:hypothetical protein
MLVTFAPTPTESAEARRIERDAIERVREFWLLGTLLCSGLLVLTAAMLLVVGWRSCKRTG